MLKFRTMVTGTDGRCPPRVHRGRSRTWMPARRERPVQGRSVRLDHASRQLPAPHEPRRAPAALQRAARGHVARRPASLPAVRGRSSSSAHHFERFSFRPGMTGLWQVTARGHASFHEALDLDVAYVRALVVLARPVAPLPHADRRCCARDRHAGDWLDAADRARARVGSSGSATGGRTSCATCTSSTAPRSSRSATSTRRCSIGRRALSRRRAATDDFDACSTPTTSTRSSSRRRWHPLRAGAASPRGRQARVRREAARRRPRRRRASSCGHRRERGLVLMPGHTFLYSPPVRTDPRADRLGDARRDPLHLDEPGQPRPAPVRRERRLGSRPARLLDPPLLARRDARARSPRSSARCIIPEGIRRRVHQPRVRLRRRSPTSSCPGSRRASCAARTIVGSREDGRLRRHERRAGAHLRLGRRPARRRRPSASTG